MRATSLSPSRSGLAFGQFRGLFGGSARQSSVGISTFSPTFATVGDGATLLTVTGIGFTATSIINVDGTARTTNVVNGTTLTTLLSSADLATPGFLVITVTDAFYPAISSPVFFPVNALAPTVTSISPTTILGGGADLPVVVTGTNFFARTVAQVNGSDVATSFTDATHVTATVPASAMASAGTLQVAVRNPAPGGGTSTTRPLTVSAYLAPTITSLVPDTVPLSVADIVISVVGTNFYAATTATANGSVALAVAYVDATHLNVTVPASFLAGTGTVALRVTNPTPGGGTSAPATLTVIALEAPYTISGMAYWLDPRRHAEAGPQKYIYAGMGPVSATGTSPPTVTVTGTPTQAVNLVVDMNSIGGVGVATFLYSLDAGVTWAAEQPTAASVPIAAGLTLGFAAGTYNANNLYTSNVVISAAPSREAAPPSAAIDTTKTASQATAASRPELVLVDAQVNNKPILRFRGAQSLATLGWSANLAVPSTHYLVGIVDVSSATTHTFTDGPSVGRAAFQKDATHHDLFQYQSASAATPAAAGLSWHIFCGIVDEFGNVSVYMDDAATPKAVTSGAGTGAVSGKLIGVQQGGTTNFLTGRIATLVSYSGSHSLAQRQTVGGFFASLFNLTWTTSTTPSTLAPYSVPGLVWWLDPSRHADFGVGYTYGTMGPVTATGTTPPAVTMTGTATVAMNLRIEITTGGALGAALFRYSVDGGVSFAATGQTTAAAYGPVSGVTFQFGAGTYATDNVYVAQVRIAAAPSRESSINDVNSSKTVSQVTAANQPTLIMADNQVAFKATLKFSGGQLLASPNWDTPLALPATHYLVCISDDAVAPGNACFVDGVSAAAHAFSKNMTNQHAFANGGASVQVPGSVTPATSWGVVAVVINAAGDATLYVNDSEVAKATASALGTGAMLNRKLGEAFGGTLKLTGRIASALSYSGEHTLAQRATVMNYLINQYLQDVPYAVSGLQYWLDPRRHADGAGGFVYGGMGNVTASGTSPPAVTTTGTATAAINLRIEITTGGTRGVAVFRYSLNGGVTYTSAVTTAATVGPFSGITFAFAAGTYSTDNVYVANVRIVAAPSRDATSGIVDNTKTLVQSTATRQFELIASDPAFGGKPVIYSPDLVPDMLSGTWSTPAPPPVTFFLVVLPPTSATSCYLLGGLNVGDQLAAFRDPSGQVGLTGAGTRFFGTFNVGAQIICIAPVMNGANNTKLYKGGSGSFVTNFDIGVTLGKNIGLGVQNLGWVNGKVAAVLIYTGTLSKPDMDLVGDWLAGQFGLTWGH